ncbi:MAG: hypothetical protein E6I71_06360 [Chloroflexi bacterium]|nr:MAG: hypothetical protein E6I71_06360 [Chloroflexota bacterium]
MFTVEQRDALRERVLTLAENDRRVVAGAAVGSLALGGPKPPAAGDLFGWGVIYGVHARACIERGRVWQAEHYIGAVRDHALSLACLRRELPAVQARGYDDLPAETLSGFNGTHVGSLEPERLRHALSAALRALIDEGKEANVPSADVVAERLAELR